MVCSVKLCSGLLTDCDYLVMLFCGGRLMPSLFLTCVVSRQLINLFDVVVVCVIVTEFSTRYGHAASGFWNYSTVHKCHIYLKNTKVGVNFSVHHPICCQSSTDDLTDDDEGTLLLVVHHVLYSVLLNEAYWFMNC